MRETKYSNKLTKALRDVAGLVVFKHADQYTSGIPDISATGFKRTLWIEVKIRRSGKFKDTDLQSQNVRKLARAGLAVYVIYDEDMEKTSVVHPVTNQIMAEFWGYDHVAVADKVVDILQGV